MTIRVALVGCGLMGQAHVPGYLAAQSRAEVTVCCDNDQGRDWTSPRCAYRWQPVIENSYPPGHWLFSQSMTGGGVIRTTAIHKLDLLRYWLGEPCRVTAFHGKSGLNPGMDSEDIAAFALEVENGAIGEAFFTFAAFQNPIPTASGELVILYSTKGMISNVNGWHMYSTELEPFSTGLTAIGLPNADYPGSFVNEVLHFVECIERGQEPLSSGRDNLDTIAVVDALYQSAATGQAAEIERL